MLISSEAENFKTYNANCNIVNAEISGNLHRRFPKDLHLNKSDTRSDYVSKVVINVWVDYQFNFADVYTVLELYKLVSKLDFQKSSQWIFYKLAIV